MTTAYKGRLGILQISTNGGSTFTTIGGAKTSNLTINNNPVDITNVSSGGFRELLPDAGAQSVDVTVDGVVASDTALKALQACADDRTLVYFKIPFGAAGSIVGAFACASLAVNNDNVDAQKFTAQLQSSGTVNITPDP